MQIHLKGLPSAQGKSIKLEMKRSDTIKQMKTKIQNIAGFPENTLNLVFKGRGLREDGLTLGECDIKKGSEIHFYVRPQRHMQIFVRNLQGKTLTFDKIEPSDTIHVLKQRIHEKEGLPTHKQRLVFIGKELHDNVALEEYNILPQPKQNILCFFLLDFI